MTDQPGDRPEQRLPVRATPVEPVPVERLGAPPSVHRAGLTPERAAQVVRQSGSARWVAFLAVTLLSLFVVVYWFYETGLPWGGGGSRLASEVGAQQVTDVSRGYRLFQANCARCHGAEGQGGIGPVLNDQAKLLTHLSEAYLTNVLAVGGRYVCGDANSLMLAWKEPAGPLNYREIEELIAFLRAPSTLEYTVTDPATGKATTLKGWRDPTFQPAAGASPVPACWKDAFGGGGTPGPSAAPGTPSPSGAPGTPAPSEAPIGTTLKISAQGIAYDTATLEAPAGIPFAIVFTNNDAGIRHNVEIRDAFGASLFTGDIFSGIETRTYQVQALPAGTYTFVCTVHPNMVGTLTVK